MIQIEIREEDQQLKQQQNLQTDPRARRPAPFAHTPEGAVARRPPVPTPPHAKRRSWFRACATVGGGQVPRHRTLRVGLTLHRCTSRVGLAPHHRLATTWFGSRACSTSAIASVPQPGLSALCPTPYKRRGEKGCEMLQMRRRSDNMIMERYDERRTGTRG